MADLRTILYRLRKLELSDDLKGFLQERNVSHPGKVYGLAQRYFKEDLSAIHELVLQDAVPDLPEDIILSDTHFEETKDLVTGSGVSLKYAYGVIIGFCKIKTCIETLYKKEKNLVANNRFKTDKYVLGEFRSDMYRLIWEELEALEPQNFCSETISGVIYGAIYCVSTWGLTYISTEAYEAFKKFQMNDSSQLIDHFVTKK